MELTKVQDIINYEGRLYIIRPYIWEGKIKRKTIYTGIKTAESLRCYSGSYGISKIGGLRWYDTVFHYSKPGEIIDENTIANRTSCTDYPLRIFTDRETAKKALEEYETFSAYKLNESIDKELKYLESEKKKINKKIKELKERKKDCFNKLTTTFAKKS